MKISINKKNKSVVFLGISFLVLFLSFTVYQTIQDQEEKNIVGTWICKSTPEWKWVFDKNGKCYDYYENKLSETYNWSISTTSPQCGKNVPTGKLFSYLKLININDPKDKYCYEILSLNDEFLQIRWIERGGFTLFKKQ